MNLPKNGVNPYAQHPGFDSGDCPLRYTVTQRNSYGQVGSCGFGCEMTGSHCVPDSNCEGRRDDAIEQDRMNEIFRLAKEHPYN